MSARCSPAWGRARIEFSICTMAGPGRPGVAVGVARGAAVALHAASRLRARPLTSTERRPFSLFIGSLSIRKGDSVARVTVWYVPSDAPARDAPESDSGRALAAQPHDGLAGPVASADGRWRVRLLRRYRAASSVVPLLHRRARLDLRDPGDREQQEHRPGSRLVRPLLGGGRPLHRAGAFVLSKRRGHQR